MNAPERINNLRIIRETFERKVGRPATPEEVSGIRRAYQRNDTVTSSIALGVIMGTNQDWPEWHQRSALDAYGLAAFMEESS